jgi:hypothetical protein
MMSTGLPVSWFYWNEEEKLIENYFSVLILSKSMANKIYISEFTEFIH